MRLRCGYAISFDTHAPTPMVALLSVHPSRCADLVTPHRIHVSPDVPCHQFTDPFGNIATRFTAPAGGVTLACDFTIHDSGLADEQAPHAEQWLVERLPDDVLPFLMGSRYCETDRLVTQAWQMFGGIAPGWARVQAIVEYVHDRIEFGYHHARATRTAFEAHEERVGVCRDFAHLAVALCRCMNIPARYCTGYLGDIRANPIDGAMDFSAWFDVFLDGRWFTFDARHNTPRVGRVLMARGRDATDCALTTMFGAATLTRFDVHSHEVAEPATGPVARPRSAAIPASLAA